MFNISEVFKKAKEDKDKGALSKNDAGPVSMQPPRMEDKVSLASFIDKDPEIIDAPRAKEIYDEALLYARMIYDSDLSGEQPLDNDFIKAIDKIIVALLKRSKELFKLLLKAYPEREDYIYYHVVNVCIMSVELGIGLGYDRNKLGELGIAALLHDIGQTEYSDLTEKRERFTKNDYNRIKNHPNRGAEILGLIAKGLDKKIIDAIRHEHERYDGSGYPQGLKSRDISEYARIIGVVDVYEAMIHKRPYRDTMTPLDTMRAILDNKKAYGLDILKCLIENIGIFPVGTYVQLNTKQISLVVKGNPKSPFRPVVDIVSDADGSKLNAPRTVDLTQSSMLFIDKCVKGG